MIRENRELLAELARLNTDMASLGMRIVDDSASGAEQRHYAERLITAGERLRRRADATGGTIVDGEVEEMREAPLVLPPYTVEQRHLMGKREQRVGNAVPAVSGRDWQAGRVAQQR